MSILCGFNKNNETVFINDDFKGNVYCFDCKKELIRKKGNIRIFHFSHKTVSNCNGESWQHKYGKEYISRNIKKIKFSNKCLKCKEEYHENFDDCYVLEEKSYKQYVLDCAVYDDNHNIVCAVEIYYTHKTTREKIDDILSSDIGYYELCANDIINNTDNNIFKNLYKKYLCTDCEEQDKQEQKLSKFTELELELEPEPKTDGIMCGRYCQTCKRKYWINNKQGFRIKNCVKCRLSRESEN